jgi:hypothetical protein
VRPIKVEGDGSGRKAIQKRWRKPHTNLKPRNLKRKNSSNIVICSNALKERRKLVHVSFVWRTSAVNMRPRAFNAVAKVERRSDGVHLRPTVWSVCAVYITENRIVTTGTTFLV